MRLLTYINKDVCSYILSNLSDFKTVVNTFAYTHIPFGAAGVKLSYQACRALPV